VRSKPALLKWAVSGGKILVSVGLLALFALRVDLDQFVRIVSHASLLEFGAAVATLGATIPVMALRWHAILRESRSPGFQTLLRVQWVGLFFNQLLPTGVGGDAVRAWRCVKLGIGLGVAIRSILLDRVSGYAVLLAIYAAGMPALMQIVYDQRVQQILTLELLGAIAGLLALLAIEWLPPRILAHRAIAPLAELSRDARQLLLQPRRLLWISLLSVTGSGLTILSYNLIGESLAIPLSFAQWVVVVPPVILVQVLPVSVAGWGLREAALVVLLSAFGIPAETALAASLGLGLCQIIAGLPGGLIWITNWDIGTTAIIQAPNAVAGPVKADTNRLEC